jgi:CheY-like chemotaxis protein
MNKTIKHICLAEDDPDDYYIFSKLLNELNSDIKLTWFQTCEALLDFLNAGIDLPCLIVLDINMPKMDGQTCLVSIKKEVKFNHIPVIILSTSDYEPDVEICYQSGAFKYFQKPFTIDEYKNVIREILETPLPARHKNH